MLKCRFQITGGSSGIGKEIAIEAVKHGANVTLLARNEVVCSVFDVHSYANESLDS